VDADRLLADGRSQLAEPSVALAGLQRLGRPFLLHLRGRFQSFAGRVDRAAEARIVGEGVAEHDDQVVEVDDGAAVALCVGVGRDEAAFAVAAPVAGRAGQHDVACFGIKEDVLDPPQAGQREHCFIGLAAEGVQQLHLPLQARERHLAKDRRPAGIAGRKDAGRLAACHCERAVGLGRELPQEARGIDIHARGELADGAGAAHVGPRLGRDGRCDQVDQRIEVGLHAAARSKEAAGAAQAIERVAPGQVAAHLSDGADRRLRAAGRGLRMGYLAQQLVARGGIFHAGCGGQCRAEFAGGEMSVERISRPTRCGERG
jgi:hypothetical protein